MIIPEVHKGVKPHKEWTVSRSFSRHMFRLLKDLLYQCAYVRDENGLTFIYSGSCK